MIMNGFCGGTFLMGRDGFVCLSANEIHTLIPPPGFPVQISLNDDMLYLHTLYQLSSEKRAWINSYSVLPSQEGWEPEASGQLNRQESFRASISRVREPGADPCTLNHCFPASRNIPCQADTTAPPSPTFRAIKAKRLI